VCTAWLYGQLLKDCPFLLRTSVPPVLLPKRVSQIAYGQSFLAVIPRREHDGVETRISLRRDAQYGSETKKAVARRKWAEHDRIRITLCRHRHSRGWLPSTEHHALRQYDLFKGHQQFRRQLVPEPKNTSGVALVSFTYRARRKIPLRETIVLFYVFLLFRRAALSNP